LPRTHQLARAWFRVHQNVHNAIFFSLNPAHRFSHPNCPDKLLYVAMDAHTCLWERLGDMMFDGGHALSRTQWDTTSISKIDVPPLHLCDLAHVGTREPPEHLPTVGRIRSQQELEGMLNHYYREAA